MDAKNIKLELARKGFEIKDVLPKKGRGTTFRSYPITTPPRQNFGEFKLNRHF